MPNKEPKREDLGFAKLTQHTFGFLVHEFGLICVEVSTTIVRYRSPAILLNIYHGRRSYEVGFEIGIIGEQGGVCYRLPTILRAVAPDYKGQTVFQASTRKSLHQCLMKVAALVMVYCGKLLRGDTQTIQAVKRAHREEARETTKLYTVIPAKNKALDAWQKKDYATVVKLYESVEADLDDLEKKRLEFSRKTLVKLGGKKG